MKKYIAIILALAFVFTVALVGCEKKEAPKPAAQPTVTPVVPAPAPAPAPAPKPAPAPMKPAKK
jgi:hypothetical protein